MPRPAFTIVSGSVAALVALGFVTQFLRPHIPRPPENKLAGEESEFLNRASGQRIDWQMPSAEAYALARRMDRPILLFIGNSHSSLSRKLDFGVFSMPRIQALLARNYVCVRVDSDAFPEYRSSLLPLSRRSAGLNEDCQLWVLTPAGKPIYPLPRYLPYFANDENAMVSALVEGRDRYGAKRSGDDTLTVAQRRDTSAVTAPEQTGGPRFDDFARQLDDDTDGVYGGFGQEGAKSPKPEAWRFMLTLGRLDQLDASFRPYLRSAAVDLIDGGFFEGSYDFRLRQPRFDKAAVTNAAMLRVLTLDQLLNKDPVSEYLRRRTFDSLTSEFLGSLGIFASRSSDEQGNGRSLRASFPVREFREQLPDDAIRTWAQDFLGMRVESNPAMTPRLAKVEAISDSRLGKVLKTLRQRSGPKPVRSGTGYCDVSGFTVARLIESARLSGNADDLGKATDLFGIVEGFRSEQTVVHSYRAGQRQGMLPDYLGYVDAALQYYLATGRYDSLQNARAVYLSALRQFSTGRPGVLRFSKPVLSPQPDWIGLPEIGDAFGESSTAWAVRLGWDLSRIFDDRVDRSAEIQAFVSAATLAFGEAAFALGPDGAGFFCDTAPVFDDGYFVVCGKGNQSLADRLSTLFPVRLCFAAFGDVRADLQARGAGIYFVRGTEIHGPLNLDEATRSASATLSPAG